jgi:biofilm PGA synthesis N-glycosyltransferase PgaC
MMYFFVIIGLLYTVLLLKLIFSFDKAPNFETHLTAENSPVPFSVLIPFRNEAENLESLVTSINQLNYIYSNFEVIFINDDSNDDSVKIIKKHISSAIDFSVIENVCVTNSGKKDAISLGISKAKFDWIITTDADCILPKESLSQYSNFAMNQDITMICGPVLIESDGSFLEMYQQIDGLSLQAVTISSFGFGNPLLCNGANIAYKKAAFKAVNGFTGNDHIASGDDVFLLQKMKDKFPNGVHFLKSWGAIVRTKPVQSWKKLINQRVRWASKTSELKELAAKAMGWIVFLTNLSLLVGAVFSFYETQNFLYFLIFLSIKLVLDFWLLSKSLLFFKLKANLVYIVLCSFLYPFITTIVVLKSINGSYIWKGRSLKK